MSVNIRHATEADSSIIAEMVSELAEYEKLSHEVVATAEHFKKHGFGSQSYFQALVAESADHNPVGFALYFYTFSTFEGQPTLKLEDLFVKPEHRGQGVGLAILAELAAIAVSRDCARVEWDVLDWNEPAIKFYRKIGALPMKDWTTFRLKGAALTDLSEKSTNG